jgi:hypothetical protein
MTVTSVDPNGYNSGSEEAEDLESFVQGDIKSSSKSGSGGQKTQIYQEVPGTIKIKENYFEESKYENTRT